MNEKQETKTQSKNVWIPLLIVVVLLGAYFIGPFRLVAVVSGSMEPTIPTGSLSGCSQSLAAQRTDHH